MEYEEEAGHLPDSEVSGVLRSRVGDGDGMVVAADGREEEGFAARRDRRA